MSDNNRCAICGWPLKGEAREGCVRGNCSQRPWPDRFYDPVRAKAEYNGALDNDPRAAAPRAPHAPSAASEQLRAALESIRWVKTLCGACGRTYLRCLSCGVGTQPTAPDSPRAQCGGHPATPCADTCLVASALAARAAPPSVAEAPTLDQAIQLRALARDEAYRRHEAHSDAIGKGVRGGHSGDFHECREPNCVLVHARLDQVFQIAPSAAEAQEPGIPAVEAVQSLGCNSSHAEAQGSPRLIELARGMALGFHTSGKPGHDLAFASCRHPDCAIVREAHAARPAPPLDWQAIETAPKGQDVLVLAGGYHCGDEGRIMVARSRDGASWWSKPGCYSIPRPISWMPLPAPPDARGDSQDESPTDR